MGFAPDRPLPPVPEGGGGGMPPPPFRGPGVPNLPQGARDGFPGSAGFNMGPGQGPGQGVRGPQSQGLGGPQSQGIGGPQGQGMGRGQAQAMGPPGGSSVGEHALHAHPPAPLLPGGGGMRPPGPNLAAMARRRRSLLARVRRQALGLLVIPELASDKVCPAQ